MKPLSIVGLDPGTTAAYAILDLEGSLIKAHSGKDLSLAQIISQVMEVSRPVIVSTDKFKVPHLVEHFSRKVGTKIFSPSCDLSREEKRQLLLKSSFPTSNDHERDSLAAALLAFRNNLSLLNKIKRFLESHPQGDKENQFIHLALMEDLSFPIIVDLISKKDEGEHQSFEVNEVTQNSKTNSKTVLSLHQKIRSLEEKNLFLQRLLAEKNTTLKDEHKKYTQLSYRVQDVDGRIDRLFSFKEKRLQQLSLDIFSLQKENEQLLQSFTKMQSFLSLALRSDFHVVKKLETLSRSEFEKKDQFLKIVNQDLVYVENPSIYSAAILDLLQSREVILLSSRAFSKDFAGKFRLISFPSHFFFTEIELYGLVAKDVLAQFAQPNLEIETLVEQYRKSRSY